MSRRRHSVDQIIGMLRQADVDRGALPIEDNGEKSSGTFGKLMEVSFLIRLAS